MCISCGCGNGDAVVAGGHGNHPHAHTHAPFGATHVHGLSNERVLEIEENILAENDAFAEANRRMLLKHGIFAINLVSSPGSGKTTLLVETIERLKKKYPVAVIEGDQQTSNDADRIQETGAPVVQINTGKGCHLDAHMVGHALQHLHDDGHLHHHGLLMIENVGNLVCPAGFDLGEMHKVVILSVTEGEDKPLKYPEMFRVADYMVLSKTDLLPYLDFDIEKAVGYARQVNPGIRIFQLSTKSGEGMEAWIDWLAEACGRAQANGFPHD